MEVPLIEPTKFILFVGVSWALIIAPGPDMLYVITRGVTQGRGAGMLSALGVICGILVLTIAAAFGLTLIIQTSAFAFLLLKYLGAIYLITLGVKAWWDTSTFSLQTSTTSIVSTGFSGREFCRMSSILKLPFSFWLSCLSLLIKQALISHYKWSFWA